MTWKQSVAVRAAIRNSKLKLGALEMGLSMALTIKGYVAGRGTTKDHAIPWANKQDSMTQSPASTCLREAVTLIKVPPVLHDSWDRT